MKLKVLIGCEESQEVCKAFNHLGHFANSCDIQPCSGDLPFLHIQDDIFHVLHKPPYSYGMDIFIGHPPCTYLANSSVRWLVSVKQKPGFQWSEQHQIFINAERWGKMVDAAIFFRSLLHTNAEGVCIENPIMHKYALDIIGEKQTQIIQPWQYGEPESKKTCLWLKNLPPLQPTNILPLPECGYWNNQTPSGQNKLGPSANRAALRGKTYKGIALAMARQWGS